MRCQRAQVRADERRWRFAAAAPIGGRLVGARPPATRGGSFGLLLGVLGRPRNVRRDRKRGLVHWRGAGESVRARWCNGDL